MGERSHMKDLLKRVEVPSHRDGFTLVEVLVALALTGIVMAGIYSAYYSQQKSYVVQESTAVLQQNLRAAMYLMEREIRMAGCDPQGSAGAGIINAGANTLNFSEDIGDGAGGNPNGVATDTGENITYALSGTNLTRTAGGGGAQTVAENIQSVNFVYLNASGTPIAQPIAATDLVNIRSVQINMIATDSNQTRVLASLVKCRNLGLQ
jgi:type IV pilus assembly protein PilW